MAKVKEKKALEKKNWTQSFTLIGKVSLSKFTFMLDQHSESSDWIYNRMNLNIDCGEKYGLVSCELMGGYGAGRDNVIYVHGKDDNGNDDFQNTYQIDWDDRFDTDIQEDIGRMCFLNIGIEKDTKGNVAIQRFLHAYDVIKYLSEYLVDGMEVKVRGQLRYSVYQDNVQMQKEVNSIYLKNDKDEYGATFRQTVLIDKYSLGKLNKEKNSFPITGYVLEKMKTYNGNDLTEGGTVRGGKFVPLSRNFEYEFDPNIDPEVLKRALKLMFDTKKGYTQYTYKGVFIEGGAIVQTTYDDLTDEIKELVDNGLYDLDEALAQCTENTGRERRMILRKPDIKMVGEEGEKKPQIQKFVDIYSEEDLQLDYLIKHEDEEDDEEGNDYTVIEDSDDGTDTSWMDELGL